MVAERGRRIRTAITRACVEGDAAALPLPDESFDAVVIGFGLLHLPDPASALAEAHRVLKPGGRLAFSVWEEPSRGNDAFAALLDALAEHGDKEAALPDTSAGAPLSSLARTHSKPEVAPVRSTPFSREASERAASQNF